MSAPDRARSFRTSAVNFSRRGRTLRVPTTYHGKARAFASVTGYVVADAAAVNSDFVDGCAFTPAQKLSASR
jgi:hypothetical protein